MGKGVAENAIGAILEIPSTALEKINKAQRYIENLQIASNKASEAVSKHWSERATSGLATFIDKLAEAKRKMEDLGTINVTLNTNAAVKSGEQLSSQMQKTTSDVSKAAQDIASVWNEKLMGMKAPFGFDVIDTRSVKAIEEQLSSLRAAWRESGEGENRRTFMVDNVELTRQQLADLIAYLEKGIKQWRDFSDAKNDALAKMQSKADADAVKEYTDLLKEQFKYQKQLNELKNKISVREAKSGIGATSNESQQITDLEAKLKTIGSQLSTVHDKYAQLSEDGRKAWDTAYTDAIIAKQQAQINLTDKEREALKRIADEQKRKDDAAQKQTNKSYLDEEKRLLGNILDLRKQISAAESKVAVGTMTKSATLEQDKKDLETLRKSLQETKAAYAELYKEERKNLDSQGLVSSQIQLEKYKNGILAQTIKLRQEENKSLIRGSEISSMAQSQKARLGNTPEAAIQRQLNSDYKEMLKLLQQSGDIKAKAAEQGRSLTQNEIDLIAILRQRYNLFRDDIKRISGEYVTLGENARKMFEHNRSEVAKRNMVAYEDATRKAAAAAQKLAEAQAKATTKDLSSEYVKLTQRLREINAAMNDYLASGGKTSNPSYMALEQDYIAIMARRKEIAQKNIDDVNQYRLQMSQQAYQADLSAYVQYEAQKKSAAKAASKQAAEERLAKYRQSLQEYQGAMRQADAVLSGTGTGHFATNLENIKRALADLKAASGNLNLLNPADVQKAEQLKKKIAELEALLKRYKNAATPDKPAINPQDAIQAAKTATTLRELERAYKGLKEAMANTSASDPMWSRMNTQLQTTKKSIDDIKAKMGELNNQSTQTANIMGQLQSRIAAAFSIGAITGFAKKVTEVRAQFELQRVALGAILQDTNEANKVFVQVQNMALQSPFSIMQLERATKQIAAFGFEGNKLMPTLKMLADMSAGLGVDIDRLILVMGHLKARNFLEGTMVRQFTNAGFNVLGELSKYYSELEGKMVSVGEVQDRVKKKMVSFGDVEEVLKRVTSAGGMFYDMQKKQSDSIWGQMQRITDAYDLMLNEIGQQNESSIKAALTAVRTLIANWEYIEGAIKSVGAGFLAYNVQALIMASNTSRVVKVLASMRSALNNVLEMLMKNPAAIWASVIAAITIAIINLNRKVNEAKKAYDTVIESTDADESKLRGIAERISENNNLILDSSRKASTAKKGTAEYSEAVKENAKALEEQEKALQELRNNFPEVYDEISKTTEGVVELTDALDNFIATSKMKMIIATLSQQDTSWFNEDFKTDMTDLEKSSEAYNAQLAKAEAYYNTYIAKVSALYATQKATGDLSEKDEARFKQILALKNSQLTTEEKIRKAIELGSGKASGILADARRGFYDLEQAFLDLDKGYLASAFKRDTKEAEEECDKFLQRILYAAGVTSVEMFKSLPTETQKAAVEAGENVIRELGLTLDKVQMDMINKHIFIPIGFKFENTDEKKPLGYLGKQINTYLTQHPTVKLPAITSEEDPDTYFKKLKASRKADLEDIKQYRKARIQLDEKYTNEEMVNRLQAQSKAREEMEKYFGIYEEPKKSKRSSRQTDPIKKRWEDRLDAVKRYYDGAEKARQKLSESETKEQQTYSMKDLFAHLRMDKVPGLSLNELLAKGFDPKTLKYEFTEALKVLLKYVPAQYSELRTKIQETIASESIEIQFKVADEQKEKLQQSITELFDNYELTKELRGVGVPIEMTYMLGGKPTELADVRKEYFRLMEDFASKSEEDQDVIKKMGDDIRKKELSAQKQQLQNYVKYLTESMVERVQIELNAQREISKIRQDENLDEFSKQQAIFQRTKKMQDELAQYDFNQFKASDVYTNVFKDLERASKDQLQYVIDKFKELQRVNENLSPTQVKAIASELKKAEDALAEKSAYSDMIANLKNAVKYAKERNTLLGKQQGIQTQLDVAQEKLEASQRKLYDLQVSFKSVNQSNTEEWNEAALKVGKQQGEVKMLLQLVKNLKQQLAGVTGEIEEGENAWRNFRGALTRFSKGMKEVRDSVGAVFDGLDSMGLVSDSFRDVYESMNEVLDGVETFISALEGMDITKPFSIITGSIKAIGGIFKSIGGLFSFGDKKKNRQIEKLSDKVEELDKAYQNLEKSIEAAYTFDDYNAGYEQMQKNLQQRKQALSEMIALEESKKKSDKDKIKEYKNELAEIAEAEKELHDQRIEAMGSTKDYLSQAENFVSAWLDAYKETGSGLDALKGSWEEFVENLFMKQAAAQIVSSRLKGVIDIINNAIDSRATGFDLAAAVNQAREEWTDQAEIINTILEQLYKSYGLGMTEGEFLLSDLQKGIQNITEPQAAAIEAYMNSIRMAVFQHTGQLNTLIATIQMQYGEGAENPIVSELKGIRIVLDSIDSRLGSVIDARMGGGAALRMSV